MKYIPEKTIKFLKKKIGITEADFKFFGGKFLTYDEFCEYQHQMIAELSYDQAVILERYIRGLIALRPRHVDFYTPCEQYIVHGVYFHENGKLMNYSRP